MVVMQLVYFSMINSGGKTGCITLTTDVEIYMSLGDPTPGLVTHHRLPTHGRQKVSQSRDGTRILKVCRKTFTKLVRLLGGYLG